MRVSNVVHDPVRSERVAQGMLCQCVLCALLTCKRFNRFPDPCCVLWAQAANNTADVGVAVARDLKSVDARLTALEERQPANSTAGRADLKPHLP